MAAANVNPSMFAKLAGPSAELQRQHQQLLQAHQALFQQHAVSAALNATSGSLPTNYARALYTNSPMGESSGRSERSDRDRDRGDRDRDRDRRLCLEPAL